VEKGKGVIVTCIIRWGMLHCEDYVMSGIHGGRVNSLSDGTLNHAFILLCSFVTRVFEFFSFLHCRFKIIK
jgi:translation initiation factor IF-2